MSALDRTSRRGHSRGSTPRRGSTSKEMFLPGGVFSAAVQGYEYRESQVAMAEAVASALEANETLLVEAPTGTGKTWAYLIPAILSGKKVLISTGTKTLQDQLYQKDLPLLASLMPSSFTASVLKGKSNYLCRYRFDPWREQSAFLDMDPDAETLKSWAQTTATGDRAEVVSLSEEAQVWQEVSVKGEACLGGKCPEYERCFITRAKLSAAAVDIVIVNHHLFFADLALKEGSYGAVLPHYDAVIFDEAHLLEEVAEQYFGISMSSYRVEEFARDALREFVSHKDPSCVGPCRNILEKSRTFFEPFRQDQTRYRLTKEQMTPKMQEAGGQLILSLDRLREAMGRLRLQHEGISHLAERIERLQEEISLFLTIEEGTYLYWVETAQTGVFLHASPLDVSTLLGERLFRRGIPMILTSATLTSPRPHPPQGSHPSQVSQTSQGSHPSQTPKVACGDFDYIKDRLGIDLAEEMTLPTPFDYEKQTLLYLPRHLPPPSSDRFIAAISDEIVRVLQETGGRALLLFTSWKVLTAVHRNISPCLPYRLLKQGDQPKQALLDLFRREVSSVLFGTASFWQGVDVPGEALSCVIIDKLPFASPSDPLVAARVASLTQEGKDPFLSYQLPAAILLLRQGFGRLIRSRNDRGMIVILDHRVTKQWYGKFFLKSLPPARKTHAFEEVHAFFNPEHGRC